MAGIGGMGGMIQEKLLATLRDMQGEANILAKGPSPDKQQDAGKSFSDYLKDGVQEVNAMHKKADKMGMEVATGKSENLHETMLASSQAELGFNLMVQLRNKALEAYQEVMRMPV